MITTDQIHKDHYKVIAPLMMCSGVGDGLTTACVMAQAATIDALRKGLTLEKPTDEMGCACPILRRMAIRLNDSNWWSSDIERTEALRPLIPMLLDSYGDHNLTQRRIYVVINHAVRVITPMRLEWIAHNHPKKSEQIQAWIDALSAIRPIIDKESELAARDACRSTYAAATAISADAAYAAYAATYAISAAAISADAADAAYADAAYAAYADAAYAAYAAYGDAATYDAATYAAAAAPDAYAQRVKYRNSMLECFNECASLR